MKCLVVDAVSAGADLARALAERGIPSVHVRTPGLRHLVEGYGYRSASRDEFVASIDHHPGRFDTLVAWARQHGVTRVLTGSEPGVALADRLAEALGLPGNGTGLSEARRNKDAMARVLARARVPTVAGLRTGDPTRAVRHWAQRLDEAPVVVKPLQSSGSDGVTFCRSAAEIHDAVTRITATEDVFGGINREVLIQPALTGRLYEVCTVSHAGRHEVVMVVETTKRGAIFDAMRLLPRAELAPLAPVVEVARRALDALHIRYGAAHVEVMVGPWGHAVIEVAARLIGLLSASLSRAALGTDQVTRLVEVTLEPTSPSASTAPAPPRFARVVVLRSDAAGTLGPTTAPLATPLARLPSAHRVQLWVRAGAPLRETRDLVSAPGFVELLHEDAEQVALDHAAIRTLERHGLWRDGCT